MKKLALLACVAVMAGCANTTDPSTYSAGSVGQVNRTVAGVIVNARPITINSNTGAGSFAGGAAGAVAGSSIGGGARANTLGAIGGAVAGAAIGNAIESGGARSAGMEYVIQTTNGALLTVAQGTPPAFTAGDRVLVLYGSPARIIADQRPAAE